MKKLMTVLMLILTMGVHAQVQTNPYPKTISVTGSAEMEVVPDQIYVQIALREYNKKGAGKVDLEAIRKKFLESAKSVGIKESDISIVSYQGNEWLQKKKKNPDMMAGISYQVVFSDASKIDALVEKLDDEATTNFFIARTSHSQIESFRKQLKIAAVKAAKEKAKYLSEAIDEKVGVAISIEEPTETGILPMYKGVRSNTLLQESDAYDGGDEIDFKKIKLKFEVNVIFSLV